MSDSEKPPKRPQFDDSVRVSLTPEAMLEVCRKLAAEREAMSFEERAAFKWKRLQESMQRDAELFAGKTPEEIAKILDRRDDLHSNLRRLRNPNLRPILIRVDRDRFGFVLSGGSEAVGAEAALNRARKLRQRRPKPRADGW